jgi:hypothetical protein
MRYLVGFACVLAALVASPLSVSAQVEEEVTEPTVEEPAPEPAPEEPALQLQLDDAGVEVVPSQPRTDDGYTLEEMDVRVKRARIGLITSAAVFPVGIALLSVGAANACIVGSDCPGWANPVMWTGFALMGAGLYGMIVSGAMMHVRKRKLRELQEAHYRRPRRVQWDLARSRVVF